MATLLPIATRQALARSLGKYSSAVGRNVVDDALKKILGGLESILNPQQEMRDGLPVTVGANPATVRASVSSLVDQFSNDKISDFMNLDFKIEVAEDVARGAGRFVAENDPAFVDEFPAWELQRVYDRDVPRGFQRGPKGALIPVPNDDWPSRFRDACAAAGDSRSLQVLEKTGRMVALKSSGVWEELGNNRDDTLGNPFPPFAFNSGYDWDQVSIEDCVELGLMNKGEKPEPSPVDLTSLFGGLEGAA